MSVVIKSVEKGSPAAKKGLKPCDVLVSINDNEIMDVLDYRFYQNDKLLKIKGFTQSLRQLVDKTEYTFIKAGALFIHKICFKKQT